MTCARLDLFALIVETQSAYSLTRAICSHEGKEGFGKRFRSSFLETTLSQEKANQGLLTRQIQKSDFSNCSKLDVHAHTREGEEMSAKDEWMRLADVAAESKMALSTIYYLHNKGRGPKFSRLGRTVRVKRSDFDAWFEENREK